LECGALGVAKSRARHYALSGIWGKGDSGRSIQKKEEFVVKNETFLILLILTFLFSTLSVYAQTKENPPIINFAYAQENIRQGDIWKIYLSVSDPSSNMARIVCRIDQDGGVRHRPSVLYLKKGMQSGFTGYFALPTNDASSGNLWGEDWILQFTFVDRGGNEMKTLQFPLKFDGGGQMKLLPSDLEKALNQRLGTIDVEFVGD
jgi:hypothetical protein